MNEEEELLEFAKNYDSLKCSDQILLVSSMIVEALEAGNIDDVYAALIPLAIVENRVRKLEKDFGITTDKNKAWEEVIGITKFKTLIRAEQCIRNLNNSGC